MVNAAQDPAVITLDQNVCNTYLLIRLLRYIGQLWNKFYTLSHLFDMSPSQTAQKTISGDHQKEIAFISCNWPPSVRKICTCTTRICASCRMDMDEDEFHSYTGKGFLTIWHSGKFCGGVGSDMAIKHVLSKNAFWKAHMRVWNYREHSG